MNPLGGQSVDRSGLKVDYRPSSLLTQSVYRRTIRVNQMVGPVGSVQ